MRRLLLTYARHVKYVVDRTAELSVERSKEIPYCHDQSRTRAGGFLLNQPCLMQVPAGSHSRNRCARAVFNGIIVPSDQPGQLLPHLGIHLKGCFRNFNWTVAERNIRPSQRASPLASWLLAPSKILWKASNGVRTLIFEKISWTYAKKEQDIKWQNTEIWHSPALEAAAVAARMNSTLQVLQNAMIRCARTEELTSI